MTVKSVIKLTSQSLSSPEKKGSCFKTLECIVLTKSAGTQPPALRCMRGGWP